MAGESFATSLPATLLENRDLLMLLTTSIAVLIGCAVVLVWRRSSLRSVKSVEPPKLIVPKVEIEDEVDDGKKKVTVFFGTQTGTAEGFAKVNICNYMYRLSIAFLCSIRYDLTNYYRSIIRLY